MTRVPIRVTLDAAGVPMLSSQAGPTVVSVKEGMAKLKQTIGATEPPWELTEPQLIFAENVMPIPRGLTSISYTPKISGIPGVVTFSQAGTYRTSTGAVGYWAKTSDDKLYTSPVTGVSWTEVTGAGWPTNWTISIAKINGDTYFYVSYFGCYKFTNTGAISAVTLNGLTPSAVRGIAASVGRLFAYSATTLFGCSEVDPLDFIPSTSTGAFSSRIQYVRGDIIMVEGASFGLFIYAKENVVSAQETGNSAAPYLFTEVENSSGISDLELVASAPGLDAVYAFGSGGFQLVAVKQAVPIFPEVGDFMALRTLETYNYQTHKIEQATFLSRLLVKINYVSNRYLVVSYGVLSLTHMAVYDTAIKRWGKLRKDHVDVFTVTEPLTVGSYLTFLQVMVPANTMLIPAVNVKSQSSTALSNQDTFAVIDKSGGISLVDFNLIGSTELTAVAVFGRIQLRRGRECILQDAYIEGLGGGHPRYVGDSVAYRPQMYEAPLQMYEEYYDSQTMSGHYLGDSPAICHNLHIEGMFDLTGLSVVLTPDGEL